MRDDEYPIAEMFTNIQGEGTYAGTWMFFIRLAGCNVGKYEKPSDLGSAVGAPLAALRILHSNHSICTSAQGHKFLCDTDYLKRSMWTREGLLQAVKESKVEHVCITGGEPFLHDNLLQLVIALDLAEINIHIETSGTLPIKGEIARRAWITCSPKKDFDRQLLNSSRVDEWKFIVEEGDASEIFIRNCADDDDDLRRPIYIQPVGDVRTTLERNTKWALEMISRNPTWKLSAQLHKYVGGR